MDKATELRAASVRKYFTKTPEKPSYEIEIATIFLGGLGLLVGLILTIMGLVGSISSSDGTFTIILNCCVGPSFISGLGIVVSGWFVYQNTKSTYEKACAIAEPKPSDEQMDKWLIDDKQKIINAAMNKLELVREQVLRPDEPLVVIGPQMPTFVASGKDGVLRFSRYEMVVIYLTDYHLGAYTCDLDFITGLVESEQTQEYHYTDIVSVSTTNENSPFNVTTMDNKVHPIASHQQFSLSVANGDRIKVTVAFPQLEGILQEGKLLPSGAEKAISNLRAMLREKKGGFQVRK